MPRFRLLLGSLLLFAGFSGLVLAQRDPPVRLRPVRSSVVTTSTVAEPPVSDEEALKAAYLDPTDGAKLVAYLKMRTASDADQGKIQGLIKKFHSDNFDERLKAGEELEQFGPSAIGLLKTAQKDNDPEVAYQAGRVLRRVEKIPHSAAAAAAVRAVVKLKPPGAAEALLGFLPLAESEGMAEDIRGALVALAAPNGKPDPALVAALADPSPVRRGAAYVSLIEGGPATERVRIPAVYPQVKDAIRKDADPDAKFRGLWALARTTREKEFVPDLIAMIPQLPRGRLWQLEELLLQLAGTHLEGGRFGKTAESLTKARDAWAAWWDKNSGSVDAAKLDFKPRIQGFTDLVEADSRGFGMGRVSTLGPDLKEKWQLTGLRNATDAHVQPDGKVLLIENYNQVSFRDPGGAQVSVRNVNQPLSAHPLPDGGLRIVCRQLVYEFDKAGTQRWVYQRKAADIVAGRPLPNGETVFVTTAQTGPNCFRIDAKGQEAGAGITVGRLQYQPMAGMDLVGDRAVLLCEADKVAEYDLKDGKRGWTFSTAQPTSVQRLPNGNTLIASLRQNRAVEVEPGGEVVWEYKAKDGLQVARIYRR
jgi:hypothetical protein